MFKLIQLALIVICGSIIWQNSERNGIITETIEQVNRLEVFQSLVHGSSLVKN